MLFTSACFTEHPWARRPLHNQATEWKHMSNQSELWMDLSDEHSEQVVGGLGSMNRGEAGIEAVTVTAGLGTTDVDEAAGTPAAPVCRAVRLA
jgi:hypothetical protein